MKVFNPAPDPGVPLSLDLFRRLKPSPAEHVRPLVVGFAEWNGGLIGSGLLVSYRKSHFILTAGHLALKSQINGKGLALVAMVEKGAIQLCRHTEVSEAFDPGSPPPYVDVGVLKLDPIDVPKIRAWTGQDWLALPDDMPGPPHALDGSDRVYMTTGFPASRSSLEDDGPSRTLRCTYQAFLGRKHERETMEGVVCLQAEGAIYSAMPDLSGMSGAPVWVVDLKAESKAAEVTPVGIHSGRKDDAALVVPIRQHLSVLRSMSGA